MKYIGPFFRMNSLSVEDINGQLFYLSKEAIRTLALNSKCGIVSCFRSSKKSHSNNDISILSDFSPLLCIYKKSSPIFVHNKTSYGFDESTFRKTISPSSNALMTLSLLELSDYYSNYKNISKSIHSLEKPYSLLAKKQLEFYTENLRNSDGVFVEKKNISDNHSKSFNLIDNNKRFKFSDQAFMMAAYYLYSLYNENDSLSNDYKDFSLQILNMFLEFKDELYDISFDEGCKVLLAFNILYDYTHLDNCKRLIIDLSDYLINKYNEKDYYNSSLDSCCLLCINLKESFKHTKIIYFKEKSDEILEKLDSLYDNNKGIFIKPSDKKEIKYSSTEICFYFLAIFSNVDNPDSPINNKNIVSNLYRNFFINSGIISSWPDAPTLDEVERYKKLSLRSDDMLEESFFKMNNMASPETSGVAPIFNKYINYSRKKDNFSSTKQSFDSSKNLLIYFTFIHYLRNNIEQTMEFTKSNIDIPPKEDSSLTSEEIKNCESIAENNDKDIADN